MNPVHSNNEINDSDIAIIGMSGRFPGAKDIESFWQNLRDGVESIRIFSPEEVLASGVEPELLQRSNYVRAKAVVEDIDQFDASFFGFHPKEAQILDPQHRLFLECAWEALESAGYDPQTYEGVIGVYAGSGISRYYLENIYGNSDLLKSFSEFQLYLNNDSEFLATRTAYKLNLTGPAINVQTACSTSLVAIHLACQSLLSGECEMALAGGATLKVNPKIGYLYQDGMIFSPDGHCRAFDAKAQGTVGSSGVGIVTLKRATDAIAHRDYIYALIKGSAINNDGALKVGYTAPSVEGQAKAITEAQAFANVDADTITYLETHGTGTELGDPIEIAALTQAFRQSTNKKRFCAIGSLKTNMGHLNSAAGVAGLIKTALALKHRQIPPSLHFETPNPKIDFSDSPFYVSTQLSAWETHDTPRRAGVSSFGIGGTNAHIILEEAPTLNQLAEDKKHQNNLAQLLVLSAKTPSALKQATANLATYLQQNPDLNLADVAYTLSVGRRAFEHRQILACSQLGEAADVLNSPTAQTLLTSRTKSSNPPVIFMFSGQGSQYVNMARGLYENEEIFREQVDCCAEYLQPQLGLDLRHVLYPDSSNEDEAEQLQQTAIAQPVLFTIEYALAKLWEFWGVYPQGFIGHSIGEYVAACLAGVFSLEDALYLVAVRGKMIQQLPTGAMLSVPLSKEAVQSFLNEELSLAVINEPSRCVISGTKEAIAALQNQMTAQGVESRFLKTSHAFHSQMMNPILDSFAKQVQKVTLNSPQKPFVSNVTGDWITPAQATDPRYWSQHLRSTVQFARGLNLFFQKPEQVLLEVGPGRTLSTFAKRHPNRNATQVVLTSLRYPQEQDSDVAFVLKTLGQLWLAGVEVDWDNFYAHQSCSRIPLPTYPFERQRYWVEPMKTSAGKSNSGDPPKTNDAAISPSPQPQLIPLLKEAFADISGLEANQLDEDTSFLEMGFDSLTLTQITLAIEKKFHLKITFRQLLEEFPTIKSLSEYLAKEITPDVLTNVNPQSTSLEDKSVSIADSSFPNLPFQIEASPTTSANNLELIVAQQLQIMSRQIDLLSQGKNVLSPQAETTPNQSILSKLNNQLINNNSSRGAVHNSSNNGKIASPQDSSQTFGAAARISRNKGKELTPTQQEFLRGLIERYTTKTANSKDYAQSNRSHFADPRTVSGFSPSLKEMVYPIVVVRSAGSKLWDLDGNEYIDLVNGFGSSLLGYSEPSIQEAIASQLKRGWEIGPQTHDAGEVAQLICTLTHFDRAAFCNTGSEAVLGAMRIARTVTGRSKIAIFSGAYHGIFDEVIVRGTKDLRAIPAASGIMAETLQNIIVVDYASAESIRILEAQAGELAAILVEPVQSRRPEIQPQDFLRQLRRITEQSGTVLIFDEIITGFRIDQGGAQAYFGIQADIATYGKVVGGGMPIGVIAGKSQFMDALDGGFWQFGDKSVPEVGVTFFAGTFVRHPLAVAAAKATLQYIQQTGADLYRQLNEKSHQFVTKLNLSFQNMKAPLKLVNFGSLMMLKFTESVPLSELLFYLLREQGVHIQENRPIFLTLAHSEADLESIIQAFEKSVWQMQQVGFLQPSSTNYAVVTSDHPTNEQIDGSQLSNSIPLNPPIPGAKLGRDPQGNPAWYLPDPERPGNYLEIQV